MIWHVKTNFSRFLQKKKRKDFRRTYSGTDIEEIENTEEGIFEEEDTTIDFKSGDKFYIDNETRYVERINY